VPLGRVLNGLAWWAFERGNTADARAYADRAKQLADQLGHPKTTREALSLLAAIDGMDGDIRGSLQHSTQTLALALELGDLEGQALAQSHIGVAHHLLGDMSGSRDDYYVALDHYQHARALDQRLGRRLQQGMTSANMAQIQVRTGRDLEARRLLHEALTLVRQAEGIPSLLFCVLVEADRRLTNGEVSSALELMGAVRHHPAINNDNLSEIERILGRVTLPADVIEAGMARGAGQDFHARIDRLADELASAAGAS
jgi:tetratricopeptide (TPR) repeat protein